MALCSSAQRKKRKIHKIKLQKPGCHDEFLNRITKTLYYGKIPMTDRFSLPVSELAAELFSEAKKGFSLDNLYIDEAAEISRNACVSPCSLVLALLYLERLKSCNSEYIEKVASSELFLVSMMVASKFLHDDGEEDEVFNDEWATSAGLSLKDVNRLEREFLKAIDWEVYVNEQLFWSRLHDLEAKLALRMGRRRGWLTYSELAMLVNAAELLSLAHGLIAVSAVCITSYTASVLAMVGSTIIVNQIPTLATSVAISPLHLSALLSTTLDASACSSTNSTTYTEWQDLPPLLTTEGEDISACSSTNSTFHTEWQDLPSLLTIEEDGNHSFMYPGLNKFYGTSVQTQHVGVNNNNRNCSEQKVWLSSVIELVKAHSSTRIYPSMIAPVEILTY